MAEQEPQAPRNDAEKDVNDRLAQLDAEQAALEERRAQIIAEKERLEGWGAYDTPESGDKNDYQAYLASRKRRGAIRDEGGDGFIDSVTGKRATQARYDRQNGTAWDHYSKLVNLENAQEHEEPNYETMSQLELTREAARLKVLGEPEGKSPALKAIRAEVQRRYTEDALHPKNDGISPEKSQEAYDQAMKQFDARVEHFMQKSADKEAEAIGDKWWETEKKEGFGEKMKKWGASLKRVVSEAGVTKWAQRWSESLRGNLDAILDRGVDQNASEEEKEQKRNENRRKSKLGGDAQAGASAPDGATQPVAESDDVLRGEHTPRKEYTVKQGDKLEDLFRKLDLLDDTQKSWDKFSRVSLELARKYPEDLVFDASKGVSMRKSGLLSGELRAQIEDLYRRGRL